MSTADSSFHYMLVGLSLVLTGLLTVPIYWGSARTKELFDNFYYIWAKLKNGDEECKDVEWRRRIVLETKVIRMFPKISQSRRRPLLGPSPG